MHHLRSPLVALFVPLAVHATDVGLLAQTHCLEWSLAMPAPRRYHAMAFDSSRGVLVVHGGRYDVNDVAAPEWADTWEWDGEHWSQRPSPSAVFSGSLEMFYDSARQLCAMVGQVVYNGLDYTQQTWTWNGQQWEFKTSLWNQFSLDATTYDVRRGIGVANDFPLTKEWDGSQWIERAHMNLRSGAGMTFDSTRGRVMAFGGWNGSPESGRRLWEWNDVLGVWNLVSTCPGEPRTNAAVTYDPVREAVVVHGGNWPNSQPITLYDDTWLWHSTTGRWEQLQGSRPPGRRNPKVVWDSTHKSLLMYGGHTRGDMWMLSPERTTGWELLRDYPQQRGNASMVFDAARGEVILFGGREGDGSTWAWKDDRWEQRATTGPSRRFCTAMAYDSRRQVIVLFGGASLTGPSATSGDTWEWNGKQWRLVATTGPAKRRNHSLVYDEARGVTMLLGGRGSTLGNAIEGHWEWDGVNWTQRNVAQPPKRYQHLMFWDPIRQTVVVDGGRDEGVLHTDTWEWNGSQWSLLDVSSARPISSDPVAAYDPRREAVLAYVKPSDILVSRVWEWKDQQWTPGVQGLPREDGCAMAFDTLRNRMVVYGGEANVQTWVLKESRFDAADINRDGVVGVTDLLEVICHWGPCATELCPADVAPCEGDGEVGVDDLLLVVIDWGS